MNDIQILEEMNRLETAEEAWRKLYKANPYDDISVKSWEDFVRQYRENMHTPAELPPEPISDLSPYFYESQFFSKKPDADFIQPSDAFDLVYPPKASSEIVVFKHLRYLPVFYHALEFVKVVYVVQGSCRFYLNDRIYQLPQNSLLIFCPDIVQSFFAPDDDAIVINIIMRASSFEKIFYPLLNESNEISDYFWQMLYVKNFSDILQFDCTGDTEISHLVFQLFYESQMNPLNSLLVINSYVLLLFARLIRSHTDHMVRYSGSKKNSSISRILQFIMDRKSTVTLSMISEHFQLSKGYLSRFIKAETGHTFSALLRKIRLEEAKHLLSHTTLSIEEIVFQTGYTDVPNFYRTFRKCYGMTPGEFRNIYNSAQ